MLYEVITDSTFANLTLSNLGLLYHTTGRYALAEEYTKAALEKRESNPDKTGYAASLNNLAVFRITSYNVCYTKLLRQSFCK